MDKVGWECPRHGKALGGMPHCPFHEEPGASFVAVLLKKVLQYTLVSALTSEKCLPGSVHLHFV